MLDHQRTDPVQIGPYALRRLLAMLKDPHMTGLSPEVVGGFRCPSELDMQDSRI